MIADAADPLAPLSATLVERCEDLPADLPPGAYVVIDVMYFSTTVVELLANGARHVHVTDERGAEFAYRERMPDARLGGDSTADYEPAGEYDFFNSPSYVQSVDVRDRPASMTSTNGGRTVTDLRRRGGEDVEVYVGSTTNAAALAAHLRDAHDAGRVYLVSAGSTGEVATEDHVGALLIAKRLDDAAVSELELAVYRELLAVAKGENYVERHEVRRRDVHDYVTAVDSRRVVPKLDGRCLVDVGEASERRDDGTATPS